VSATGSGDSLGEALLAAIAAAAGSDRPGEYRSYTATGWHAQLSKLTSSGRGYQAAESVGLSASARTLKAWLSEQQTPSPANRSLIERAYRAMAGRWPGAAIEGKDIRITGRVGIGSDVRARGTAGAAPFLIDGSAGSWDAIRDEWQSGEPDAEQVEDDFIEDVLEADLGEATEEWSFPGGGYTVTIG
jgi:hypothetical protein